MKIELIREKDRTFPLLSNPDAITFLKVWHCSYESLRRIQDFHSLETLVIASYPDNDFTPLSMLKRLKVLQIIHMPEVDDLSPLSELSSLYTLSLQTLPSWDSSGKKTIVKSLRPLANLKTLRHMELFGVVPESRSLSEITDMTFLETASFSKYAKKEIADFFSATGVRRDWNPPIK